MSLSSLVRLGLPVVSKRGFSARRSRSSGQSDTRGDRGVPCWPGRSGIKSSTVPVPYSSTRRPGASRPCQVGTQVPSTLEPVCIVLISEADPEFSWRERKVSFCGGHVRDWGRSKKRKKAKKDVPETRQRRIIIVIVIRPTRRPGRMKQRLFGFPIETQKA